MFSEVSTVFEYNVSTILSPIVANNTSISYVFLVNFIYYGFFYSSFFSMFFTDSGRKLPWFLALFFHHTPYLCQLINETKTESPAESESYLMFSGNYPSPLELPFKKYNYFCWCKEFSDPLYIYNHETCLLSEFLNRNSMYLFPSKAYIKVCNQLTMPICRSTTFCSIHSIQQKDLML